MATKVQMLKQLDVLRASIEELPEGTFNALVLGVSTEKQMDEGLIRMTPYGSILGRYDAIEGVMDFLIDRFEAIRAGGDIGQAASPGREPGWEPGT